MWLLERNNIGIHIKWFKYHIYINARNMNLELYTGYFLWWPDIFTRKMVFELHDPPDCERFFRVRWLVFGFKLEIGERHNYTLTHDGYEDVLRCVDCGRVKDIETACPQPNPTHTLTQFQYGMRAL